MKGVLAIAAVELRRFVKDRSNIFFVFVLPIALVMLIGSQFGGGGSAGSVEVAGPDDSFRDALVAQLRAGDLDVSYGSSGDVRQQLARGRTDVGLFLAAEDADALAAGDDVVVEVVASSQPTAQLVLQKVRTALRKVAWEQGQQRVLEASGVAADEAEAALRTARQSSPEPALVAPEDETEAAFEGLGQFDLGAASQTLLFVFLSSLTGAATLIQARRYGVVRRVLAAPLSTRQVITGQALGRLAIALLQGGWIMVGSAVFFDVDWGSWPAALVVLLAFSTVAAAAAMAIGAAVDNEGAASGVGVGAGLVLGALGGCMTPLEFFPETLRAVAHVTPHAWAYDAFAEIQRRDGGVIDVLPELGVLAAMASVLLFLGSMMLRRSLDRAL